MACKYSAQSVKLKEEKIIPHKIEFKITHKAATHNKKILSAHGNNYGNLLKSQKETILSPGSEFR